MTTPTPTPTPAARAPKPSGGRYTRITDQSQYDTLGYSELPTFTTGMVARLCACAPRTVSKWIDAGEFPGSYRLPGSSDRRIPRPGLLAFLTRYKMQVALDRLGEKKTLVAIDCDAPAGTPAGWVVAELDYASGSVAAITNLSVAAVLVHGSVGMAYALQLARAVRTRREFGTPFLALAVGPDHAGGRGECRAFDVWFEDPVSPVDFWPLVVQ